MHAVVAGSTFGSENVQNASCSDDFGSCDVEKVHAVVGRSTFASENVKKNNILGPLLEVAMLKQCTPLWCEAHVEVNMYKTPHVRAIYERPDVAQMWKKCTPLWCEAHF